MVVGWTYLLAITDSLTLRALARSCLQHLPRGSNITLYRRNGCTGSGDNYTIYPTEPPNG